MPAIYTIPVTTVDRHAHHLMVANGGEFDCGKWRFRDIGDAASAVIDLYRHTGAKLSLKRERVRAMIADGTGASAWGYDEFAPDLDVETASEAQLDALLEAGVAARRVLGSRKLYLQREDVEGERHESFDDRARRSWSRARVRSTERGALH